MRRATTLCVVLVLAASLIPALTPATANASTPAKYIILFHADGMAGKHIEAGGYYVCGSRPCLSFESFANQTTMTHNNAGGGVTDSAASATAMATGVKVNNGVISRRLPGDGSELRSLLETHRDIGKSTGLVTEAYLTDASPAAHGAHESSRSNTSAIFLDYVNQTRPNVILGGGGNGFSSSAASSAGYTVVTDLNGLMALNTEAVTYVAGGFRSGLIPPVGYPGRSASLPTLPQMTDRALRILDNDPHGFYLFVEHEGTDEYSHANDAANLVRSLAEFSSAVQVAIDWVNDPATPAEWSNTLFVVVSDHETGGITGVVNNGAGVVPAITFTTTNHTTTPVRVFARGAGAEQITGAQIDNTQIFAFLSPVVLPPDAPSNLVATGISQAQINLAWADNSDAETGFKIERSPDGVNSWKQIVTVGANVTVYPNIGLAANTTYHYRVRAYNGGGDSAPSDTANATTAPALPTRTWMTTLPGSQ
jgi:alkaline phosphatase